MPHTCRLARVGCEPARRNVQKINSEEEGRAIPQVSGWALPSSGAKQESWKDAGHVPGWACSGRAGWVLGLSPNATFGTFRVGLGAGWKADPRRCPAHGHGLFQQLPCSWVRLQGCSGNAGILH